MLELYNCIAVDHDLRLIALAAFVCFLASGVAISLFHRARAMAGRKRLIWWGLNATAAGCGIWATHFIAMLAYTPAVGAGYDLALTGLSLLIAVLITGSGLGIVLLNANRWTALAGGAVVGSGIAAMHYTGMMALELAGRVTWSPGTLFASVALGIVFGATAMFFANKRDDWRTTLPASVFLTLAIVGMHFTGMSAVRVLPEPTLSAGALSLAPESFSLLIASATTIILGMCLVAALSNRKWESKLRQQKNFLDATLETMSQGLCVFDASGRILMFNDRYSKMVGIPAAALRGLSLIDVVRRREGLEISPEEFVAGVLASARDGKCSARTIKTAAGRSLRVVEQPRPEGGWVATFEDITEWLEQQARIAHMAHHDALTDLANRTQLVEKLTKLLTTLPTQGCLAVHFIDLDRFKRVNDTLGHDAGDYLLKSIAERLRAQAGPDDVVARLGGDEFVVVQSAVQGDEVAEAFAKRLVDAVKAPLKYKEQSIHADISVGIALAPRDGSSADRLLKSADLALYKAKSEGRDCVRFFAPEMDTELQSRIKLERTIRNAIEHGLFELHYQPIFEMSGRRLAGFEALIRLPGEDGGLIPPLEFIPLADELRLIDQIGAWVLREACRNAATWPDDLTISVNLSPAQFLNGSISETVASALREAGLAAHRLELEITENLLLSSTEATMAELRKLKAMGVAIVMDDFGTGYSSLSYLWKFPFDKIKIDRSFMQGLDRSGRDAETIVKTIIALGRELNIRVTVEGVETARQASFLEEAESDQAQGYFFGRPVPAAELGGKILADLQQKNAAAKEPKLKLVAAAG